MDDYRKRWRKINAKLSKVVTSPNFNDSNGQPEVCKGHASEHRFNHEMQELESSDVGANMHAFGTSESLESLQDDHYISELSDYQTDSDSGSDSSDHANQTSGTQVSIAQDLANWAVDNSIPHSTLSKLLSILQPCHVELPMDPRKSYTVTDSPGQ